LLLLSQGRPLQKKLTKIQEEERQRLNSCDMAVMADGYVSCDVLAITKDSYIDEWILDSGCLFHTTPKSKSRMIRFDSYNKVDAGKVLMDNNIACEVMGIRNVKVRLIDGSTNVFTEVGHVSDQKRNRIFLIMLDQGGCSFNGEGEDLKSLRGLLN
jgi:hypothetical protein